MGGRRADAAIFADAPVQDLDLSRQRRGQGAVVGDDHDGGSLAVQILEQAEDGRSGGAVEIAGGFIGKQQRRFVGQGTCKSNALRLTARKFRREAMHMVSQPDPAQ